MLPAVFVLTLHLPRAAFYLNAHLVALVFGYDALLIERVVVLRQPELFQDAPPVLLGYLTVMGFLHIMPPFNEYCRRSRRIYTFPENLGRLLRFLGLLRDSSVSFFRQRSHFATFCSHVERAVDAVFHVEQLAELGAEALVLGVFGVVTMCKRIKLALPVVDVDAVRQLASGKVELPQLAFVLGLELLTLGFPLDGVQLVVKRLEKFELLSVSQTVAQLFRALFVSAQHGFYFVKLRVKQCETFFEVIEGVQLMLAQV